MASRNTKLTALAMQIFYTSYSHLIQVNAEIDQHVKLMRQLKANSRSICMDYLHMTPEQLRSAHIQKVVIRDSVYSKLPEKLFTLYYSKFLFEEEVMNVFLESEAKAGAEGETDTQDEAPTPLQEDYLWDQVWADKNVLSKVYDTLAEAPQVVVKRFADLCVRNDVPLPEPIVPIIDAARRSVVVCPTPKAVSALESGTETLRASVVGGTPLLPRSGVFSTSLGPGAALDATTGGKSQLALSGLDK